MTARNLATASPEVVVNDMFLSPRVIDRRAYTELAGEIREIIGQAAAERAALTAALDQASSADQGFRHHEAAQAVNIDLCTKALKKIDEKTARVEALLARAEDAAAALEVVDAKADAIVAAKVNALEARLEVIQAAASAKTEALEERLRTAARDMEQRIEAIRRDAETIIAPSMDSLRRVCDRAAAIAGTEPGEIGPVRAGSLLDLTSRAESLAKLAEETIERSASDRASYDSWLVQAQARIDSLERHRIEIGGMTTDLIEQAERTISSLRARLAEQENLSTARAVELRDDARRAIEDLEGRLDDARRESQAALLEYKPRADAILAELRQEGWRSVEDMEARLEVARNQTQGAFAEAKPRADALLGDLHSSIQRAQDAHNTTGLALRMLEKASTNAEAALAKLKPWQGLLSDSEGGSAEIPLPIKRMIDSVRGGMQADLAHIAAALRAAASGADRALQSVGEMPIGSQARVRDTQGHSAD